MSKSEFKVTDIPHLGGSKIGCRFSRNFNPGLPTLKLVNSFATSPDLNLQQFSDERMRSKTNLIAMELFGHGASRAPNDPFTYSAKR